MKLTSQVTNLGISKRLKELGMKQESLFWWCYKSNGVDPRNKVDHRFEWFLERYPRDEDDKVNKYISAFTVAELGVLLRKCLDQGQDYNQEDDLQGNFEHSCWWKNEANARGRMLIKLIQEGLVKAKDL